MSRHTYSQQHRRHIVVAVATLSQISDEVTSIRSNKFCLSVLLRHLLALALMHMKAVSAEGDKGPHAFYPTLRCSMRPREETSSKKSSFATQSPAEEEEECTLEGDMALLWVYCGIIALCLLPCGRGGGWPFISCADFSVLEDLRVIALLPR